MKHPIAKTKTKFYKVVYTAISLFTVYFAAPTSAFAQNFFKIDADNFLPRIFQIAFGVGIGSGIILIGISGLTIATAAGNAEIIQKGREQLMSALIGLGVVVFSLVILNTLAGLFGIPPEFYNNF